MVTSWWKLMVTSCHIMLWESLDAVGHFSHDENPLVSCWWPNSEADAYNQVTSEICNGTFRFKQKETKARRYRGTFRVCLLLFFFLSFFSLPARDQSKGDPFTSQQAVKLLLLFLSQLHQKLSTVSENLLKGNTSSHFRLSVYAVDLWRYSTDTRLLLYGKNESGWWDVKRHSSRTTSDLGRNYSLLYSLTLFSSW